MFQCLIFFFSKETEYKTFIAFVSHTALDERKQDLTYNQMWVNKDAIPTAKIISLVALNALNFSGSIILNCYQAPRYLQWPGRGSSLFPIYRMNWLIKLVLRLILLKIVKIYVCQAKDDVRQNDSQRRFSAQRCCVKSWCRVTWMSGQFSAQFLLCKFLNRRQLTRNAKSQILLNIRKRPRYSSSDKGS